MSFSFSNRHILLTGASSGIGWHLSQQLARQGARLALVARRADRLRDLAGLIAAAGGLRPLECVCDVGDWDQVEEMEKQVAVELGHIDVLINNAGRGAWGPLAQADPGDLEAVVRTNLTGVVHVTRAFLPAMVARGSGHLVFVSSVLGELPAPHHAVYGSTKFAVTALAESLRHELVSDNIDVTTVEPGLVRSDFASVSGTPAVRFEQLPSKSPARTAEQIVEAIRSRSRLAVTDPLSAQAIRVRRHAPRLFARLFDIVSRRALRGDSPQGNRDG